MTNAELPIGVDFILRHLSTEHVLVSTPENILPPESRDLLPTLGTGMSALYQVATCHRACRGGNHIIESLTGRGYNLAGASLLLVRHGYYDEALNLTRSIAEIANLLTMFAVVPDRYEDWVKCSRSDRLHRYKPAAVRTRIESSGHPCLVDGPTYQELCEQATHVTPTTSPNAHDDEGKRYLGGVPQTEGMKKGMETLTTMVVNVAMVATKLVAQDALFEQVDAAIKEMDSRSIGA